MFEFTLPLLSCLTEMLTLCSGHCQGTENVSSSLWASTGIALQGGWVGTGRQGPSRRLSQKPGKPGAAGAAPALGMGHLPGDTYRLGPGWAVD